MFFLMNNTVLELEPSEHVPELQGHRFRGLSFDEVIALGRELFSQYPDLQITHPQRAQRLAYLIFIKVPGINAVQFTPLRRGCGPADVGFRYCNLAFEVMANLVARQKGDGLDSTWVDRLVWGRLAA
ncbi:MAG: hypothetical protein CGW95_00775 [Phenylobacterium zucineum]|nr:MAG: hypothetical protein CGW95_00775 [Phenylobacterium zucineum]